jgi:hypothetical protein
VHESHFDAHEAWGYANEYDLVADGLVTSGLRENYGLRNNGSHKIKEDYPIHWGIPSNGYLPVRKSIYSSRVHGLGEQALPRRSTSPDTIYTVEKIASNSKIIVAMAID